MNSSISIREAVREDSPFVKQIMDESLSNYYDGDHCAHAQRILSTHLQGGLDHVGHFSDVQKMFIAMYRDQQAGMVHLVGKKQGTFKISPLIIVSDLRGSLGIGSCLLAFAEQYAQSHDARQMYCTVAEQNTSAHQFFLRKGYIVAGRSHSHYKPGITETMMYRLFLSESVLSCLDQPSISVVPFNEKIHGHEARKLMLSRLPGHFYGTIP